MPLGVGPQDLDGGALPPRKISPPLYSPLAELGEPAGAANDDPDPTGSIHAARAGLPRTASHRPDNFPGQGNDAGYLPGGQQPDEASLNKPAGSYYAPPASAAVSGHTLPSREEDWRAAQARVALCERFLELTGAPHFYTVTGAARALGCSPSLFSGSESLISRYRRGGAAALLPERREPAAGSLGELSRWIESLGWFIPAANWFYTRTNLNRTRGSIPEAIYRTISLPNLPPEWPRALRNRFGAFLAKFGPDLPVCPVELRESILARQKAGQPLVPARIARQVAVDDNAVAYQRSPRDWELNTLSAPGSQRRQRLADGRRAIMAPGDWFGGDDATQGIGVCVPCDEVITPCSEKFHVLLGRFQWLPFIDCRTDKILAWDFVVRPRGSFRAEDVLHGMGLVTRLHQIPRRGWQFEGGTFRSNAVREAIRLMGCDLWPTYSPHQKAIESIFNRVWTRLAVQFPHADLGRRRGENEANCKVYQACKQGQRDPRKFFPTLRALIAVFDDEVARHNGTRIESTQYGQWVPDQFFSQAVSEQPLRPFTAEMRWIFSPFSVERTVRGMTVSCGVPMFEDFSVPFDFGAGWLPEFRGRKVRMHFDPHAPSDACTAKLVLVEGFGRHRAGEILGDVPLIGETSGHIRFALEIAQDDQQAGYVARQRAAKWMRRVGRSVGIGGRIEYASDEQRDGVAGGRTAEREAGPLVVPASAGPQAAPLRHPRGEQTPDFGYARRLARLREESNE